MAATHYERSIGGNWSNILTWSDADGGIAGISIPVAGDTANMTSNAGGTLTVDVSSACAIFDASATAAATFAGSAALAVSGNWLFGTNLTQNYTGAITYNSTSGTQQVTSNGKQFKGTITQNGIGGTVQLQDTFSSNTTVTLTNGTFDFNGVTATMTKFSSNNANTRTVALGNAQITLNATSGVTWDFTTATGLTLTTGGTSKLIFASVTAGQVQMQGGGKTYDDLQYLSGTQQLILVGANTFRDVTVTSAGTFTVNNSTVFRNLDFTGATGTWSGSAVTHTISGYLTMVSGMSRTNTGALTFTATSGTKNITCGTKTLASVVTFNGAGGTWALQDTFDNTASTITLTAGTLTTNGNIVKCTTFSSSNSNVRVINFGDTQLTCTGQGNVCQFQTSTNLTLNFTSAFKILLTAINGVSTFLSGGLTFNDLTWSGGSSSLGFNGNPTFRDVVLSNTNATATFAQNVTFTCRNFDMTGFAGTFSSSGALVASGNVVFACTTFTYGGAITLNASSGTQTVNFGGKSLSGSLTINCPGATAQFNTNGLTTTSSTTHTAGTLDTNGLAVSSPQFVSANTNTRALALGATQWTITGSVATPFDFSTTTGLTLTPGTSKFIFGALSGTQTFQTGGQTFYDLTVTGGTGTLAFGGSNPTFHDFTISAATVATVQIGGMSFRHLDFTSFTGTWSSAANDNMSGNLTMVAGMTLSYTGTLTCNGTGAQSITCGGKAPAFPLVVNGSGAQVVTLIDAFTSTAAITVSSAGSALKITSTTTATTTAFAATGTSGSHVALAAVTPGSAATLSVASGEQVSAYLDCTDIHATGGAVFFAGRGGIDHGGNTGIRFTDRYKAPPMAA